MTQTGTMDTLETLTVERNALLAMGDKAPIERKRAFTSRCIAFNSATESKSTAIDDEIPLGLINGFDERALIDAIKDGHEIGVYRTESSFDIELLTEHYKLRNARYSDMPSTLDRVDVATAPEPRRKWKDRKNGESFLAWHVRMVEYRNQQTENTRAKRGGLISAARKLEVSIEAENTKRYLADCKLAMRLGVDINPTMLNREEIEAFVVSALAKGSKGQILALKSGLVDANLLPEPSHSSRAKAESVLALLRGCFGKSISSPVGKVKRPNYFDSELALSKALQYARFIQEERLNPPLSPAHRSPYHVRDTPMIGWYSSVPKPWLERSNPLNKTTLGRRYFTLSEPWLGMNLTDKTRDVRCFEEQLADPTGNRLPYWERGYFLPDTAYWSELSLVYRPRSDAYEVHYDAKTRDATFTTTSYGVAKKDSIGGKHRLYPDYLSRDNANGVYSVYPRVSAIMNAPSAAPSTTKLPLNVLGRADGVYSVFPRPNVVVSASPAPSAPSKGTKYNPAYSAYRPSTLLGSGRMF